MRRTCETMVEPMFSTIDSTRLAVRVAEPEYHPLSRKVIGGSLICRSTYVLHAYLNRFGGISLNLADALRHNGMVSKQAWFYTVSLFRSSGRGTRYSLTNPTLVLCKIAGNNFEREFLVIIGQDSGRYREVRDSDVNENGHGCRRCCFSLLSSSCSWMHE